MAIRLHAVTLLDGHHDDAGWADGATVAPFRDLAAVISEQKTFTIQPVTASDVEAHRAVVDALFLQGSVLPAPVGIVFRDREVLRKWMELHYVSLTDALAFIDDRVVARVHMARADGKLDERDSGTDLAAAAAEAYRALRRRAVAVVPLKREKMTGIVLSGAFLLERDLWKGFLDAVEEQHRAHAILEFDVTGPWAPYDFVRMQFGG
jgi:Gas vesicle synthesis protein GvpL/GvpF